MLIKATRPIAALRRALQDRVNDIRDKKLDGPITVDGVRYECGTKSMLMLLETVATISAGIQLPAGYVWRSADNENIPHTAQTITALAVAAFKYRAGVYKKSFDLKDEIQDSSSPSSIDIKSGWPNPTE